MNLRKELKDFRKKFTNFNIGKCDVYYVTHQELLNGYHKFESKFVSVDNIIGAIAFDGNEVQEVIACLNKKYNDE